MTIVFIIYNSYHKKYITVFNFYLNLMTLNLVFCDT